MMTLSLSHYLTLAAVLFAISIVGIVLNRKNLIVLLMAVEFPCDTAQANRKDQSL